MMVPLSSQGAAPEGGACHTFIRQDPKVLHAALSFNVMYSLLNAPAVAAVVARRGALTEYAQEIGISIDHAKNLNRIRQDPKVLHATLSFNVMYSLLSCPEDLKDDIIACCD